MKKILSLLMVLMICIGVFVLIGQNAVKADDVLSGNHYGVDWRITSDGELIIGDGGEQTYRLGYTTGSTGGSYGFHNYRSQITSIRFDGVVHGASDMSYFFAGCNKVTSIDLTGFKTENVTKLNNMFAGDALITSLDVSGFDTSHVTNMSYMFGGCSKLSSLDLSHFDTSNVTNMSQMFDNCGSLTSLDLSMFDMQRVTNVYRMFGGCTNIRSMDLHGWQLTSLTTCPSFSNLTKLSDLNVSGWNTSTITDMNSLFASCSSLVNLDLSSWNVSSVRSMQSMFQGDRLLSNLNLKGWNVGNVSNMTQMFYNCIALGSLDIGGWNTSNVTTMSGMFGGCYALHSLDLSAWNMSKVTSMQGMFQNCKALTQLDLSNANPQALTTLNQTFDGCESLTQLDVPWNTPSLTNMRLTFQSCKSLKNLDLSTWNTSRVTTMQGCFNICSMLEHLDMSNFDTHNVTTMSSTFSNMDKLCEVDLSSNFVFVSDGVLPTPRGDAYTGKWIREDEAYGPYTPSELRDSYTAEMAGKWVWQLASTDYTLSFAVGESGTGAMQSVTASAGEDFTIPANQFVAFGYDFDHWDDGQNHMYSDKGTIPANTYAAEQSITLTAVWTPRDTSLNWNGNEAEFSIRGGEQAFIDGIPAGTSYQVYELTPDGWVLVQQENASGVIEALQESAATFWNKYQPGVTTAQFSGLKKLDGQPAKADAFEFELWEGETLIGSAKTQDGGFIQFDVIEYDNTMLGEHVYTIHEVDPNDDSIDYDMHKETVTVNVVDNGDGTLSSTVTYDDDGIQFNNTTRPGNLRITKEAENGTDVNADDTFTIEIEFRNESGMPINDDIYWYIEGSSN